MFLRFFCFYILIFLSFSCDNSKQDDNSTQSAQKQSIVLLKTVHGNTLIRLYPDKAPNTTIRFIELIKDGFYDGLQFYHVAKNSFIETGDPTNKGKLGSGKRMPLEANGLKPKKGSLIMKALKEDRHRCDSQFYIQIAETNFLQDNPLSGVVFGQVTDGLDNLSLIQIGDKILSISIE